MINIKIHHKKRYFAVFVLFLIALMQAGPMPAQGITIDGAFTDWAGKAAWVDPQGPDDENSPSRADITEFRADAVSNGLYLLMAWDDTAFSGGQTTTAGITLQMAGSAYYRIYATAQGNPGSVPLSSLDINSCTNATCQNQTDICTGSGCSGAQTGSGTSWTDPFSGRSSPDCNGTNCATQDTAVEIYIPWSLVGGTPGNGQFILLQLGSYPSGPAQAPKDSTGPNGIACRNNGGTFQCYPSTPTVVTLKSFSATSARNPPGAVGLIGGIVLFLVGIGTGLWRHRAPETKSACFRLWR